MASIYNAVVSSQRGWSAPSRCCSLFVMCSLRTGLQPCGSHACCAGTLVMCMLSQGGELSRAHCRAGQASAHQQLLHPIGGYQTLRKHSTKGQSNCTGMQYVIPTPWHTGCQPPWGLHAREEHDCKTFINGKGRFGERQTLTGCLGRETK